MIRTHIEDAILSITLDRPAKKNAQTPEMLHAIIEAVSALDASERGARGDASPAAARRATPPAPAQAGTAKDVRAILLRGEGDVFCAGFDLSLCRDDPTMLSRLLTGLYDAVRALRLAPVPVVAAAHGAALAGGCALVCGADFVITNADARFGYPVARLGISPAVNAAFLTNAVGPAACRELLFSGSVITGREATRLGVASECVERADQVLPRARELAAALAAKPAAAMATTRRWLNELEGTFDEQRSRSGLEASLSLVGNPEERERLAALWSR